MSRQRAISLLHALLRQRMPALVLILFAMGQTAALLHAETHAFHQADELCAVFHSVEHQPGLAGAVLALDGVSTAIEEPATNLPTAVLPSKTLSFLARAPPQHISKTNS